MIIDKLVESRIPAGVLDENTEFFAKSVDDIPHFAKEGIICSCERMPEPMYQTMLTDASNSPKWWQILENWHGADERRKVYQHIACRYGSFNSTPDIDGDGNLTPDVRICNRCHTCEGFGEGCIRLENLSHREMLAVVLIAQGMADKQVQDAMGITSNTLIEYKKRLSEKLKAHSKIEIVSRFYNAAI